MLVRGMIQPKAVMAPRISALSVSTATRTIGGMPCFFKWSAKRLRW